MITIELGTKNIAPEITHKLMEGAPLCAAAAIHLGPSTEAMLKSRTSQKPIAWRSWLLGSAEAGASLTK
jgi:hypothetical protein